MHPGGIKFGLSQDLLELRGAHVVVSARFLENISAIARRWIRRRKRAMPQWEDIVGEALYSTPYSLEGSTRQEHVPFYMGLDRVILQTMMPIAEEAGMGKRSGDKYFVSSELITRVSKDTRSIHAPTLTAAADAVPQDLYKYHLFVQRERPATPPACRTPRDLRAEPLDDLARKSADRRVHERALHEWQVPRRGLIDNPNF